MRLISLKIQNLFGRFNYDIDISGSAGVVIITAPNGFGKSTCLQIIADLFDKRFANIAAQRFEKILYRFDDGHILELEKKRKNPEEGEASESQLLSYKIKKSNKISSQGSLDLDFEVREVRMHLNRRVPYLERHSINTFFDKREDDFISVFEAAQRYSDYLPKSLQQSINLPKDLDTFLEKTDCYFIETQRLLIISEADDRRGTTMRTMVNRNAADLAKRINETTQAYAAEAQRLDQSFPNRLLKALSARPPKEDTLSKKLNAIETRRSELANVALIDQSLAPLNYEKEISDSTVRKVLSLYAKDTESKFKIFDNLYAKIDLFLRIINSHFTYKSVAIDKEEGISVVDENGTPLNPKDLSSGEQHELVLVYNLLFRTSPNTLVLIDEPELSLHVAWQKSFLNDLFRIRDVQPFNAVIATHSPQIINDRWEFVTELGPIGE